MNKSLSTRLMYSFMALIMVIVVGVTAGISYLIADYFFKTNEQELAEKGNEMAATVEYFMGFSNSMEMLNRYVFAVDRLVGARICLTISLSFWPRPTSIQIINRTAHAPALRI